MPNNIVERAIVPHNPSSNRIINNNQYNLFAPIAGIGKVGMAGFKLSDFDVDNNQIVSISATFKTTLLNGVAYESWADDKFYTKEHIDDNFHTKEDSYSKSEMQIQLAGKIGTAQKGAPNGVAELDANSKIKMAQVPLDTDANLAANSDSKIPSQKAVRGYVDNRFRLKSDSFTKLETMALVGNNGIIVDTYAQMLALPTPTNMLRCYVRDATGDTSVASGGAYYLYDAAQTRWVKTSEEESLDIIQDASHLKVIPRTGFLEDFNSSNQEELNTKLIWGILGAAQNAAIKSGEAQFNFIQYEYDMAVATFEALSNIPPDELYDKLVCVVRSSGVWYEWSADSQSWSIILPISTEMSGMVYYNYTGDVDPGTQTVTIYGDFTMILPLPALIYMMFVGGLNSIPGNDAQKLEIFNLIKNNPMSYIRIDMGDTESMRMAFNASDINFLYAQEEDAEMIAFFGNCMTPGDGVWLLRKMIIKHDENDPQYVWIDSNYTEVIENKQDKTDQNLQTQSKDIVGAINEVKGLAEAAGSDIASNWGNLYVNTQGSDENGFGTLKKPYKTITKALSMAISGGIINVAPGAYNEDILFDSNVANGITLLAYGATLDQSKWLSVEDGYNGLNVKGITLNGGLFVKDSSTALGSEFEDITVLGDTNISQAGGDVSFKNCKIIGNQNGGVLIGSASPNTNRKIRFNNCEFIGHDPWGLNRSTYVGPNGPDVIITNCRGIRAILDGGRVYFYGNNQFSMGESLISTVNAGAGYLHVGSGASFKNEDGQYGHINKTGTCDYVLGAVDRDAANDILNGTRLYDNKVNDIGGFAELYAKAITGESEYGGTVVGNLNNITKNGFYTCYGTATGVPSASSSWWVLHQNSNVGTAAASQIAIAYSDMPGQSMVRYRIKTSGTWWGTWGMIPDTAFVDFMIAQAFNNPTFTGNVTVPTASGANHAVNKGQMDAAILSVTMDYDLVIRTQAQFDTFVANCRNSTLTAKSILIVGGGGSGSISGSPAGSYCYTYAVNGGGHLRLPVTVTDLTGINNATIAVYATSATKVLNIATGNKTIVQGLAFYGYSSGDLMVSVQGLVGAKGAVINCETRPYGVSGNGSVGFGGCNNLSNCNVVGQNAINNSAYDDCNYAVMCKFSNVTSGWTGTNTKRDDDSCDI